MSIIEDALEKARKETTPKAPESATAWERPVPISAPVEKPVPQARTEQPESPRPARPASPVRPPADYGTGKGYTGEEYRLLKERLLTISRPHNGRGRGMNLFMVTSPMRNEGKTVVSCNLAMSLAHDFDHTVLLIDADLRAAGCHKLLGIPRPAGLVDCLTGGLSFSDALVHTGVGRLSFLSAGTTGGNPSELFSSNRMRDLLHELKTRYADRIIIIDTSPILPFAETRSLSRIVDGVILVARENITRKAHLESALRSLEGSNVLGIVYNDAANFGADKEVFTLGHTY